MHSERDALKLKENFGKGRSEEEIFDRDQVLQKIPPHSSRNRWNSILGLNKVLNHPSCDLTIRQREAGVPFYSQKTPSQAL